MKLTDPYFEAKFMKNTTAAGWSRTSELVGADGVWFYCPCGVGNPNGAHGVIVSFANPRGCSPAPPDAGSQSRDGKPSRWTMTGTGLADLTLQPSVDVGTPSCWHGWVKNGEVT